MLIRLGKWLRAAGYDTWFISEKVDDIQMFDIAVKKKRMLKRIDKGKIIEDLPELVGKNYDDFKICSERQKIYWQGSHAEDMLATLKRWNSM